LTVWKSFGKREVRSTYIGLVEEVPGDLVMLIAFDDTRNGEAGPIYREPQEIFLGLAMH